MKKPARPKKCKSCGVKFQPERTLQPTCSPRCAIDLTNAQKERKVKRVKREKRKAHNDTDRRYQLKKAQESFNAFIRERDKEDACISCGRHHTGQYHAGHYRSVGAIGALRFNQFNVSRQCSACNVHLSGNIHGYRKGLLKKFGVKKVEWLEGNHEPAKLSLEEIKAIRVFYQKMLKRMKE